MRSVPRSKEIATTIRDRYAWPVPAIACGDWVRLHCGGVKLDDSRGFAEFFAWT
jgi:hypothetical protein